MMLNRRSSFSVLLKRMLGVVFIAAMSFSSLAQAASYELKNMTPAVESAIGSRQARYSDIQTLKAGGFVGENNRGYLEVLQDKGGAGSVVAAENNDRRTIYEAIASQNDLGATGLAVIETVFAEVQHEKSRPADFVQDPSGKWVQK